MAVSGYVGMLAWQFSGDIPPLWSHPSSFYPVHFRVGNVLPPQALVKKWLMSVVSQGFPSALWLGCVTLYTLHMYA